MGKKTISIPDCLTAKIEPIPILRFTSDSDMFTRLASMMFLVSEELVTEDQRRFAKRAFYHWAYGGIIGG